ARSDRRRDFGCAIVSRRTVERLDRCSKRSGRGASATWRGMPRLNRRNRSSAMSSPRSKPANVESGFHRRVDFIDWYCELRGTGPTIVLIPSGEGDCASFEKVATSLSRQFTVLTFDMPGFSRSSDPPDFANYSMSRAAHEVAGLVQ